MLPLDQPAVHATLAVTFAAVGLTIALPAYRSIRDTTLIGPWSWLAFALLASGGSELCIALGSLTPPVVKMLRLITACMTFLPLMSLLGARRPHHHAWHFIVLSLWAILILPALEGLLLRPERIPDLRGIRAAFLLGLVALGVLNHAGTRFGVAALLAGLGQTLLLSEHLAWLAPLDPAPQVPAWAAGEAIVIVALIAAKLAPARKRSDDSALNAYWFDFRDQFGLLWGLRFSERINAAAQVADWPVELRWNGFQARGEASWDEWRTREDFAKLEQAVDNLLRRFVSPRWMTASQENARGSVD